MPSSGEQEVARGQLRGRCVGQAGQEGDAEVVAEGVAVAPVQDTTDEAAAAIKAFASDQALAIGGDLHRDASLRRLAGQWCRAPDEVTLVYVAR